MTTLEAIALAQITESAVEIRSTLRGAMRDCRMSADLRDRLWSVMHAAELIERNAGNGHNRDLDAASKVE